MTKDVSLYSRFEHTRRFFFGTTIAIISVAALSTFIPRGLKESVDASQALPGLTGLSVVEVSSGTAPFINVFVPLAGILLIAFMVTLVFHWKKY